jgi:tripartite-type tricarboxylate transporter receptor subunit TctC
MFQKASVFVQPGFIWEYERHFILFNKQDKNSNTGGASMCKLRVILPIFLLVAGFILTPVTGQALDFPKGPITIICGHAPGGAVDRNIRVLADLAQKYLGQPVVVENVTGGAGSVAIARVVAKKPDGYFLCISGPPYHRISLWTKIPFNTVEDTTPIIQVWGHTFCLVVRADSPFKNLKDLVAYAKANPNKLKHMSTGIGSGMHTVMVQLEQAAGVQFTHVPGRGDAEAATAILGGHVDMMAGSFATANPLVLAGKFRILAVFAEERVKSCPNVPTAKELGYNAIMTSPLGIHGPKGLPEEIVRVLHDGFKKAMFDPVFISHCEKNGNPILYKNTEDYKKYMRATYAEEKAVYDRIVSQMKK